MTIHYFGKGTLSVNGVVIGTVAEIRIAPPRIFVFCNTRGCQRPPGTWHSMIAIAEDGHVLAGHICSHHGYAAHDMGIDPDGWKRDLYAKHYPQGFTVEWVEDVEQHPDLQAALKLNQALPRPPDPFEEVDVEMVPMEAPALPPAGKEEP